MFSNYNHYKASRIFLIIFCILFSTKNAYSTQSAIEKYGQSKSEPIDGGFFFYDDEYVEAPYIVERLGLEIFINRYKVGFVPEPYDWRVLEDPGPPPTDSNLPTKIPCPNNEYYNQYWGLKYRYLLAYNDEEQAKREFIELMRRIPGVAKIETDPDDAEQLIIYFNSGRTQFFDWTPGEFEGIEYAPVPGKEELIQRAEESRQFYEQRLRNNNGFFDRSKGGNMTMGVSAALRIVDVLVSESSPGGRMNALAAPGSSRLLHDPWRSQIENMRITPQLGERAKRIRMEISNRNRARNTLSQTRGNLDRITSPENNVGNIDTTSDNHVSANISTSSSSNDTNNGTASVNVKNAEQESQVFHPNSNSDGSRVLGLQTLLPIAGAGALILVGII